MPYRYTTAPPNAKEFTYLGSIMDDSCSLDSGVEHRMKAASSAFGRLAKRVFLNHNLVTSTKVAVYKAVCVSVMLYGCEAWTPYRRHIKALQAFRIRSLQIILGIRLWQKVPNVELFEKAAIIPAEHSLLQRQLRWLGYVIRMSENRLPRRLLYGELTVGQRSVGCPKKRCVDHTKVNLLKCNIEPNDLEVLASDRDVWIGGLCATLVSAASRKTGSLPLKHDALTVTQLLQSQRPVQDALSATESLHPSSDYRDTCGLKPSLATLRNSATPSSNPTDFSSSSSSIDIIKTQ